MNFWRMKNELLSYYWIEMVEKQTVSTKLTLNIIMLIMAIVISLTNQNNFSLTKWLWDIGFFFFEKEYISKMKIKDFDFIYSYCCYNYFVQSKWIMKKNRQTNKWTTLMEKKEINLSMTLKHLIFYFDYIMITKLDKYEINEKNK